MQYMNNKMSSDPRKIVYYAHCMKSYYTGLERKDIAVLERMGFKVINPSNPIYEPGWEEKGMDFAKELIDQCDLFAFRREVNGKIAYGVAIELDIATSKGMDIIELPNEISNRMSRKETRDHVLSGGSEVDWYRERVKRKYGIK